MRYLLDTGVWLWSIDPVEKLNKTARTLLADGQQEIFFSAVVAWELAIKAALKKLNLPSTPAECIPAFTRRQGLLPLVITQPHAIKVYDLPHHHADPFDRLLIAQAILEDMTILTADRIFGKYPVEIVWCGK